MFDFRRFFITLPLMVLCLIMVIISSSCIFSTNTFRPVRYYDLGGAEVINNGGPYVRFLKFSVDGPYKTKMLFRTTSNQLRVDDYNKWVQTPSVMLKRYLKLAFRAKPLGSVKPQYSMELSILSFEADELTKHAVFIVEYKIINLRSKNEKIFVKSLSRKMENMKAEDFVRVMSKISANFAEELKSEILELK